MRDDTGATESSGHKTPGLAPPRQSGGWEIRHEIARGGMGVVYLAFDNTLGRFMAIKRLVGGGDMKAVMQARFLREARAMATLNHIHICRIYSIAEDSEGPYIAMEYVAGPVPAADTGQPAPPLSLETMIHRRSALTQAQTLDVIGKVANAVSHAHRHGVFHRDLKPANVLIDEHGEPRVVDFGLAALAVNPGERLTVTGDKLLSIGYGAPEQEMDATDVDHRADIYALGGMVYFCLTGENPRYYRDNRVPEPLRQPLLRALEQDRDKRWNSIEEFMSALKEAVESDAHPVPGFDGWVCKWCHTLNSINDRYCEDCEWDGLTLCPQCEAPLRFGVRMCPACKADQRAFEDADGLLDLLRDLRRRKQFEKLLQRALALDALHAKGAVSETTYRQIAELRQGAAWAVERKDELRRAIAAATASEDYERMRALLNEYDVIDTSDTYGDLRARLPEKIASRHIAKLHQRLQTARAFMEQKRLSSCRAIMTALRDQQHLIMSTAETVPALRQAVAQQTSPPDPDGPAPEDAAGLLAYCGVAIDRLEDELSAEEQRIRDWQTEAETAFHNQDYHHCIRLCREVELITAEPTPAEALLSRATEAYQTIDRLNKQAQQALDSKQWQKAGDLANQLRLNWKSNHADARRILDSLERRRRMHRLRKAASLIAWMLAIYVLSMPPVMRLRDTRQIPAPADTIVFRPLIRLYKLTPLRHYARFWGLR